MTIYFNIFDFGNIEYTPLNFQFPSTKKFTWYYTQDKYINFEIINLAYLISTLYLLIIILNNIYYMDFLSYSDHYDLIIQVYFRKQSKNTFNHCIEYFNKS